MLERFSSFKVNTAPKMFYNEKIFLLNETKGSDSVWYAQVHSLCWDFYKWKAKTEKLILFALTEKFLRAENPVVSFSERIQTFSSSFLRGKKVVMRRILQLLTLRQEWTNKTEDNIYKKKSLFIVDVFKLHGRFLKKKKKKVMFLYFFLLCISLHPLFCEPPQIHTH